MQNRTRQNRPCRQSGEKQRKLEQSIMLNWAKQNKDDGTEQKIIKQTENNKTDGKDHVC